MDYKQEKSNVCLTLTKEESIVLLDWLARFNSQDHATLFEDQAEQKILYDLEAVMEKVVDATFASDYIKRLQEARDKIRD